MSDGFASAPRVLLSAPLSLAPDLSANRTAAYRKTCLVLDLLLDLGCEPTLVESLHTGALGRLTPEASLTLPWPGGRTIRVIRPPSFLCSRLTKAVQPIVAPAVARRFAGGGAPALGWLYNTYTFESRMAGALTRRGIPYVLQLEDLPWLRRECGRPFKAWLDSRHFDRVLAAAAVVLCVNSDLMALARRYNPRVLLFPPIIDPALVARAENRVPAGTSRPLRVGYCGTLTVEKGIDTLLALLERLPAGMELHIAGAGPMAERIRDAVSASGGRGIFRGFLPETDLLDFLCDVDVLVNPHADMHRLEYGVFPFKVFEYIAAGAFVVTTPLPAIADLPLHRLATFDGSPGRLLEALLALRDGGDRAEREALRRETLQRFGIAASRGVIREAVAAATAPDARRC